MFNLYPELSKDFTDSKVLLDYLNGGKAVVRLEAPSGKSHTYLYKRPENPGEFPNDVRFVYAVHNETQLFYLGMVENGRFRLTRNSRYAPDTDIIRGAYYIQRLANEQSLLDESPMKIYHLGTCAKCGRKLESEEARNIGFGRKCLVRYKKDDMLDNLPFD